MKAFARASLACFCLASLVSAFGPPWDNNGGPPWANGGDNDPFAGTGSDSNGFFNSGLFDSESEFNQARRSRSIHGVLAGLAFIIVFPSGAILMRAVPGRLALWIHAIVQLIALVLFIAAVALGFWLIGNVQPGGYNLFQLRGSFHYRIGVVVLILMLLQPILGYIHHRRFKKLHRRTGWSWAHLLVGRIGITLGIVNGGLGLWISGAPRAATVAYGVIAAVVWLIWAFFATIAEIRKFRDRRRDRQGIELHNRGPSREAQPLAAGAARDVEKGSRRSRESR